MTEVRKDHEDVSEAAQGFQSGKKALQEVEQRPFQPIR